MKMMRHLLILALLAGCGAADGGGDDKAKNAVPVAGAPGAADPNSANPGQAAGQDPATPAGTPAPIQSLYVTNAAALPACDAAGEGRLVYVVEETAFKACAAGAWAAVAIKGEKGDPGENGKDGNDNRIAASIFCTGSLEGTGIYVSYHAAQMTSGDVFADASVRDNVIQASGVAFYSSKQNGYTDAGVAIMYDQLDAANAGFWAISLNRESLVTTVIYKDGDQASDRTWTMAPSKCVANSFVEKPAS